MIIGPMFLIFTVGSILIADNLKNGLQEIENNAKEKTSTETPYNAGSDKINNVTEMEEKLLALTKNAVRKCPDGLTYYEQFSVPFCYILTHKHTYPPKCPYSNYMEDDTITEIYNKFVNETIWAKARRNLDGQFGEFEWLDMSTRYLDTVTNYKIFNNSISDKNCMVLFNYTRMAVSCKQEYPALCIYNYHVKSIGKYCSKHNNLINCISTNLNMDNNCYCHATTTGLKVSRETFCTKFAEPDSFQNYLLLTQLPHKKPCWFGIEQNDGIFQWSSTKESIQYSFWNADTNFSKKYGALNYTEPGWFLADDRSLECAICEISVPYQTVLIYLKHIPNTNKLEIRINNIIEIHNNFMDEYFLTCFSDYDTKNMKKKVTSMISDIIPITSPIFIKTISVNHIYPAYYWCESIQRPNFTRIRSNKILVYNNIGRHNHEYALTVEVPVPVGVDPYLKNLHVDVTDLIYRQLTIFTFVNVARPIKITKFSEEIHTMELIIHISTAKNNLNATDEYFSLSKVLRALPKKRPDVIRKIVSFLRSEVCLESTTISGNLVLHWSEAFIDKTILPQELCLLEDSSPVTRSCIGDFVSGAYWSKVDGDCYNKVISNRTLKLYTILNNETEEHSISRHLLNITSNSKDVLVVDVHLISEILQRLQEISKFCLIEIVKIVSNIMSYKNNVMKKAQLQLNSTDITLNALDIILINSKKTFKSHIQSVLTKNVIVQVSDLKNSIVTGSVLYSAPNKSKEGFDGYSIKPLYKSTLDDLLDKDFEMAVIASTNLINEIQSLTKNDNTTNDFIVAFFHNNVLFNQEENIDEYHMVINVLIPKMNRTFKNPIYTITKIQYEYNTYNCVHWKYGLNDMEEHIRGSWTDNDQPKIKHGRNIYAVCEFKHATNFALLVSNKSIRNVQTAEVNLALNIITIIGCALSLVGLTGIFVITIFFKHWRKRTRNKIMVNFSAALTAQTIFLFISDKIDQNTIKCIAIGASLHYTVLSGFAWMVVVAVLQYRKFVLVFQQPIPNFLTKCVIIGWCLPAIPVLIILIAFPESYNQNSNGICYPEGEYFYYGLVLPISLFCLINMFIFIKILVIIFSNKVKKYGAQAHEIRLHVSIAILLFFLLGMSWIFGIGITFTNDTGNTILSFIFCFTATMQGFVMFIFFILINKESRALWLNIKRIIICAQDKSKSSI